MYKKKVKVDIRSWVEQAEANPSTYRQRRAVEIVLHAISISDPYAKLFMLKGGILMGLAYGSPRLTADIDLTADFEPTNRTPQEITENLEKCMPIAAAKLGHAGVALKVISILTMPRKYYPDGRAPAIKIKVGHAAKGTKSEIALARGVGEIIEVDISFREPGKSIQILNLSNSKSLLAYSIHELIAEKYRSLIQQPIRKRNRRQDVFDLRWLMEKVSLDDADKRYIIDNIITQCAARDIVVNATSIDNPEIRARAQADWDTMNLEVGVLPDFNESYDFVAEFYKSLPWEEERH